MIRETLQILIAITLLLGLFFALLRYVKFRKNQGEFIIYLLNKLSEKNESGEKGVCSKKRI